MSELRESLDRLHSEFGINLRYEIERLDEEFAEREEQDTGFRVGGSGGISSSIRSGPTISDGEVREMFHTLRDKL